MAKKVWTPAARRAFAEKMRRAREAKSERPKIHTAKFDRTVKKVKRSLKKYHRKGNAYAIAEASLGEKRSILKRHRRKNARGGVVILVKGHGKTYYYTRDHLLIARESAAKRYGRLTASVKHTARRIAREVPAGYRVAIHSV